jgi:hypothetical protein
MQLDVEIEKKELNTEPRMMKNIEINPEVKLNKIVDLKDLDLLKQIHDFIEISKDNPNGLTYENLSLFLTLLLKTEKNLNVDKEKMKIISTQLIENMGEYINLKELIEIISNINIKDLILDIDIPSLELQVVTYSIFRETHISVEVIEKAIKKLNIYNLKEFEKKEQDGIEIYSLKYNGIFNFDKVLKFDKKDEKSLEKQILTDLILKKYIKK